MCLKNSIFILTTCVLLPTYQRQDFKHGAYKLRRNADYIYTRMQSVMRTVHYRGVRRQVELDRIRFFYEKTPHYEMGYIMGEIIERYRKLVNHERRLSEFKSTPVHLLVKKVQTVQHLFFEIIHLAGMLHEIELKYMLDPRFSSLYGKKDDQGSGAEHYMDLIKADAKRKRKNRKDSKNLLKKKKLEALESGTWAKYSKPTTRTHYWPIDYGWDIGKDWIGY